MLTLALALTLATSPGAPLRTDLFQTRLDSHVGALVPELAEGGIYRGVNNVVSGAIVTVVGIPFLVGGLYSLFSVPLAKTSSEALVYQVLGWTFAGMGAVLMLVGIPLLIVGIVNLASRPGHVSLGLDSRGQLAVLF